MPDGIASRSKAMSLLHPAFDAPMRGLCLYWLSISMALLLISKGGLLCLMAAPLLIIIYHGTHEAVHDVLWPKSLGSPSFRRYFAFMSGVIGFAIIGHNFIFMRWSHSLHHSHGRDHAINTIDGAASLGGKAATIKYYLGLVGLSYIYHEIAGYLYLISPRKYHILDRRFNPARYKQYAYVLTQSVVLVVNYYLWSLGGLEFAIVKGILMLYWGMTQNVAHYGLEIGCTDYPALICRTYRVSPVLNFLLFGAGYHHIEHHAFPRVPGLCLSNPGVIDALGARFKIRPRVRGGLAVYLRDVLNQFRGPEGKQVNGSEWRDIEVTGCR
jgi:fatty acid desaturase